VGWIMEGSLIKDHQQIRDGGGGGTGGWTGHVTFVSVLTKEKCLLAEMKAKQTRIPVLESHKSKCLSVKCFRRILILQVAT
jgi:hypothetical protein